MKKQRQTPEESQQKALNRAFWRADRARINTLAIPAGNIARQPVIERVLRISNEFFTVDAVFRKRDGVWHCIQAAHPVAWMKGAPLDRTKNELLKLGCSWEWLAVSGSAGEQSPSGHKHESYTMTSRTSAGPEAGQPARLASIEATGETQGMEKLLDQPPAGSKCSALPTT